MDFPLQNAFARLSLTLVIIVLCLLVQFRLQHHHFTDQIDGRKIRI